MKKLFKILLACSFVTGMMGCSNHQKVPQTLADKHKIVINEDYKKLSLTIPSSNMYGLDNEESFDVKRDVFINLYCEDDIVHQIKTEYRDYFGKDKASGEKSDEYKEQQYYKLIDDYDITMLRNLGYVNTQQEVGEDYISSIFIVDVDAIINEYKKEDSQIRALSANYSVEVSAYLPPYMLVDKEGKLISDTLSLTKVKEVYEKYGYELK